MPSTMGGPGFLSSAGEASPAEPGASNQTRHRTKANNYDLRIAKCNDSCTKELTKFLLSLGEENKTSALH